MNDLLDCPAILNEIREVFVRHKCPIIFANEILEDMKKDLTLQPVTDSNPRLLARKLTRYEQYRSLEICPKDDKDKQWWRDFVNNIKDATEEV